MLLSSISDTEPDFVSQPIKDGIYKYILHKVLTCLCELEKEIICMHYDPGVFGKMMQKAADEMGISQFYIPCLEKRIIMKLRREMALYE